MALLDFLGDLFGGSSRGPRITVQAPQIQVPSSVAGASREGEAFLTAMKGPLLAQLAESRGAVTEERAAVRAFLPVELAMAREELAAAISGREAAQKAGAFAEETRGFERRAREAEERFRGKIEPIQGEVLGQIAEALRTGGITAQIPIINRAFEQSRLATSNALRQLDESLARVKGVGGTPFGERIRGDILLSGEQQTSQIPTNIAQRFIDVALGMAGKSPNVTAPGLGLTVPGTNISPDVGATLASLASSGARGTETLRTGLALPGAIMQMRQPFMDVALANLNAANAATMLGPQLSTMQRGQSLDAFSRLLSTGIIAGSGVFSGRRVIS